MVPCPTTLVFQHSLVVTHSATPFELVAFAHAALFSPALSTLTTAVERGFFPQTPAAVSDDGQRSSRPNPKEPMLYHSCPTPRTACPNCPFPPSKHNNVRTHQRFAAVYEPITGQIHLSFMTSTPTASSSNHFAARLAHAFLRPSALFCTHA